MTYKVNTGAEVFELTEWNPLPAAIYSLGEPVEVEVVPRVYARGGINRVSFVRAGAAEEGF